MDVFTASTIKAVQSNHLVLVDFLTVGKPGQTSWTLARLVGVGGRYSAIRGTRPTLDAFNTEALPFVDIFSERGTMLPAFKRDPWWPIRFVVLAAIWCSRGWHSSR
jgi:hypothetical protein